MVTSRTGTARWKNLRRRVLAIAQGNGLTHCTMCGIELDYTVGRLPNSAEVDHVMPHALGGADTIDNCQVICRRDNQSKGDGTNRPRPVTNTYRMPVSPGW